MGKIHEAEVKCQSLFSIFHIKTQLVDPRNLREIKAIFIAFLNEVLSPTSSSLLATLKKHIIITL